MQRAFAEGLQAQGWQVALTTASRQTPTDLSRYDLLVLGAQAYNWCPARPIIDYLDRVGDLKGKPVVVIVSGGGMTERAMRVLQSRVVEAGGAIRDGIEIWTTRSNEERHGLSDPEAIMRRAAARLTPAPQRKTA
jgi:flavorubredoxin